MSRCLKRIPRTAGAKPAKHSTRFEKPAGA